MTKQAEVVVFGSINMDLYARIPRMPYEGETLASNLYFNTPGGKALNQAIAATRMGRTTAIVGKIGSDSFGEEILKRLQDEGVITDHIIVSRRHSTGVSFVLLDEKGNNSIITNLGANQGWNISEVAKILEMTTHAKIALLQLEMEKNIREFIIKELHHRGIKIVLNLAPVVKVSRDILSLVDYLIVNRIEAEQLTNQRIDDNETAKDAAMKLLSTGIKTVIITLGSEGALVNEKGNIYFLRAPKVGAVDTTGAGDCFCGSLAAFLLENDVKTAVQKAVIAASQSVLRLGTIDSMPYLHQLKI